MEIEFAEIVQDSPDEPLHLNIWVGGACRSFLVEDVLAKMDAVEHSVHTDKRVCACETVYVEYLKDDVWHCGFCKLPLAGNA